MAKSLDRVTSRFYGAVFEKIQPKVFCTYFLYSDNPKKSVVQHTT